ncbi:MAG: MotA/TolQ/ExbB proton channel family protein [Planctomycetota bacterium]|nr:MotA/TolQ/ExbB proton channel family protein [Planctomycetota bacterium]
MLDAVLIGGQVIYVAIALASIAGMAVVVERCMRLLPLRTRFRTGFAEVEQALRAGGGGVKPALKGLAGQDDPMARTLRRGLEASAGGTEHVRAVAQEAAQQEVAGLERGLGALAVVGQVAPLLGLLGTVIGLMQAFRAAAAAERVTPALLADGIYHALGTTAAGLCVAIPAWIAYAALSGLTGRLIDRLEFAAAELPLLCERQP